MLKINIRITPDEQEKLNVIAEQDLRLPEQVLRWLLHEEAKRRKINTPCITHTATLDHNQPTNVAVT